MKQQRIFISAPPFFLCREELENHMTEFDFRITWANSKQQMSEEELVSLIGEFDGWILGDDSCTRSVLKSGRDGNLKAIVKWGVGTDNIDFSALKEHAISFRNTPGVFGNEVADIAMAYLISLFRQTFKIHSSVLKGEWLKPTGKSLSGAKVGVIGYGNIGKNIVKRLLAADSDVVVYEIDDVKIDRNVEITFKMWPQGIEELDAIILACPLTLENEGMINAKVFASLKNSAYIVNVSRGKLIKELDLVTALSSGNLAGAALDVYEIEPLPMSNPLRQCENVIFGTHNASNTREAVFHTSILTLNLMRNLLREIK
jgi:D-3-phosphoglycerate dehydrogenase / 2-oxoglutarate reductase